MGIKSANLLLSTPSQAASKIAFPTELFTSPNTAYRAPVNQVRQVFYCLQPMFGVETQRIAEETQLQKKKHNCGYHPDSVKGHNTETPCSRYSLSAGSYLTKDKW